MRKDIKKSVGCDARSAELLDALAAEWGVSHAEAMRRCIRFTGFAVAKASPRVAKVARV